MLAAGDPVKARLIYMSTKVADAVICSRHLLRLKKEAEFHRQRLHSVIIKAFGGSYEPDQSLLGNECSAPVCRDKKFYKHEWLKLAEKMGAKLSPDIREKLNG